MLRVRVEILPGGDEQRAREIGKLEIWNVSDDDAETCDYRYTGHQKPMSGGGGCSLFTGEVKGHARIAGAWELVRKVLADVAGPIVMQSGRSDIAAQETPEAQTTEP